MQFDNIARQITPYIQCVFDIVREGIKHELPNLNINDNENKKNQTLIDSFNIIGTQNPKMWIGVQKEHINSSSTREDIYFYLNDDLRTRVFYIEAKRLPKANSTNSEEYVSGVSSTGSPSGGIERFILGIHGEPKNMLHYGMIGYVENKTIDEWVLKINEIISKKYPLGDNVLKHTLANEFVSNHSFNCHVNHSFIIHHFWVDLTKNIE